MIIISKPKTDDAINDDNAAILHLEATKTTPLLCSSQ